jgi:CheY-like chemotaxis protein
MSGAEVARRIQARRPAIPILFVTGFADRAALAGVSETHIIGSELAEKVGLALRGEVGANVVRLRAPSAVGVGEPRTAQPEVVLSCQAAAAVNFLSSVSWLSVHCRLRAVSCRELESPRGLA